MSNIDDMTVSELVALAKSTASNTTGKWLFQLFGRNNIIGTIVRDKNGEYVLTGASVVRYWGTTKGLGELAEGTTGKAKLDPLPDGTRIPHAAVLFRLPVS